VQVRQWSPGRMTSVSSRIRLRQRVVVLGPPIKPPGSELPVTVVGAVIQVDAVGAAGDEFHPSGAPGAVERQGRNGGIVHHVVLTRPADVTGSAHGTDSRRCRASMVGPGTWLEAWQMPPRMKYRVPAHSPTLSGQSLRGHRKSDTPRSGKDRVSVRTWGRTALWPNVGASGRSRASTNSVRSANVRTVWGHREQRNSNRRTCRLVRIGATASGH
jgi:hypothetical protein